jgi:AIPR protein
MPTKLSTNEFKSTLQAQLDSTAQEYDLDFSTEHGRGRAFQYWVGGVILEAEDNLDTDLLDAALYSKDLGADLVFEDEANKFMLIAQCKYVSPQKPVNEGAVNDFFHRHEHYLDRRWVQKHGSEYAASALGDYADHLADGWKIEYRFITPGQADERIQEVVRHCQSEYAARELSIECTLYDFAVLKDYYVRSLSLEESVPAEVTIDLPEGKYFEKDTPHRTIVGVLKGNSLRALYLQHKQSLYAWNIRGYLGNRGINHQIAETANDTPADFFYFNNGVSAVCTDYWLDGNQLTAENMQIINGAQTVSSLASQDPRPEIEVLFRLTKTTSVKTDKGLNHEIIKYNNSQNAVKLSDFRSNDPIHYFLADRLRYQRARGALPAFHYVRKRSVGRKGLGTGLKLEELAKIRYAFLYEPTLVHSSPKSLWTLSEDGGAYDKAFGVNGELEDAWSDDTLDRTLLSIAFHLRISQDAKEQANKDKDLKFLYRLRYHGLSLAGMQFAKSESSEIHELAHKTAYFNEAFDDFWVVARAVLVTAQTAAESQDITTFALVRSAERWALMQKEFRRQLAVRTP